MLAGLMHSRVPRIRDAAFGPCVAGSVPPHMGKDAVAAGFSTRRQMVQNASYFVEGGYDGFQSAEAGAHTTVELA